MADKVQIAILRERNMKRLVAVVQNISETVQVSPPELTTYSRDREFLHAKQLGELATWAEQVGEAIAQKGNTSEVEAVTNVNPISPAKAAKSRRRR